MARRTRSFLLNNISGQLLTNTSSSLSQVSSASIGDSNYAASYASTNAPTFTGNVTMSNSLTIGSSASNIKMYLVDDDILVNPSTVTGNLIFGGGAIKIDNGTANGSMLIADDDILINPGSNVGNLVFGGGAITTAALTINGGGTFSSSDDDILVNPGTITGNLVFGGGAIVAAALRLNGNTLSSVQRSSDSFSSSDSSLMTAAAVSSRIKEQTTFVTSVNQQGELQVVTGTARWYAPFALQVTSITAKVSTVADGAISFAVKKNGSSVKTGSITAGQSSASVSSPEFSMAEGDYITLDVTAIGTTAKGENLVVQFKYIQT